MVQRPKTALTPPNAFTTDWLLHCTKYCQLTLEYQVDTWQLSIWNLESVYFRRRGTIRPPVGCVFVFSTTADGASVLMPVAAFDAEFGGTL